ncbi:MAG: protein arginine kinase [Clostridia bacterium]|nr:protein arginine kinase [Clostridia bacterium]
MSDAVIISSRVRLARNLRDYPFPNRMSTSQGEEIAEKVREVMCGKDFCGYKFMAVKMEDLSEFDRVAMVERHLISPEFAAPDSKKLLITTENEEISIMVGEEDHLRIQVIIDGFELEKAYEIADRLDTELDKKLHFAFDKRLGYLTQCPTNLGTAMRASVMLHLPALKESRTVARIAANLSKLGLVIRGAYGEDTESVGAMYQISNQVSLGISEKSAVENLRSITEQLVNSELKTRESMMQSFEYQDKIGRSYGILITARLINHKEAVRLLSNLRMGICEGLIEGVDLATVDSLMLKIQPASLMRLKGTRLSPEERDRVRAEIIRSELRPR